MKNDKIVPGTILITLGVIFLLHSFHIFHIHWANLWRLWPIFLIIGGINLIFAHNRSPLATALKVGVVILGLGLLLFGNFGTRYNFWPGFIYNNDNNDNNDDADSTDNAVTTEGKSMFFEPYHADAHIVKLNINGGGSSYVLSDTTSQLFQANTKANYNNYEFSHHSEDSVYVLDFDMKKNSHFRWNRSGRDNMATFKLNSAPIWDMDIQTGATKLNFDLSLFKIRNLKISGGAASFDIKLGAPLVATNIDISTGVSEVTINVPRGAACKIVTDTGLTSNSFEGFNKTSDDNYETPGFASAKNKIYIKFDGGVSDFKVTRY